VLVRALEGAKARRHARIDAMPDLSLWAGLFDLRENLLGRDRRPARALRLVGRVRSPACQLH
jgi:hypothetical protein